jgi:hypothetical protein
MGKNIWKFKRQKAAIQEVTMSDKSLGQSIVKRLQALLVTTFNCFTLQYNVP